jgi:hypothetical protein
MGFSNIIMSWMGCTYYNNNYIISNMYDTTIYDILNAIIKKRRKFKIIIISIKISRKLNEILRYRFRCYSTLLHLFREFLD